MGLRLVGALYYASKLYSVVVGAVFILLITRNLSQEEFGAWGVISSLLAYALTASFVNFWVTRLRAFGDRSATPAGLVLALSFSAVSTLLLLLLAPYASRAFTVPVAALYIALAYVPVQYANGALYASVYAFNPMAAAASEVIFESFKLAAALLLALLGKVTLTSALLAVLVGHIAQFSALLVSARSEITASMKLDTLRKILSYSWLSAIGVPISLISSADVLVISHLAGNDAVSYYVVVMPFVNLIAYSYFLAKGLYQRLLTSADSKAPEHTREALRLVLMIGTPAAMGSIILAPNLLYIMNPVYEPAAPVLRVASVTALLGSLSGVLTDALQGVERADALGAKPRHLVKTIIFRLTLLGYVKAFIIIAGVAAATLARTPVEVATLARLSGLMAEITGLAVLALWGRGLGFKLPLREATKFVLAGTVMCVAVAPLSPFRIREALLAALLGTFVYFSALYFIDGWFRELTALAFKRITAMLKK